MTRGPGYLDSRSGRQNDKVHLPRIGPARYRVATLAALVFLYVIVVTGALVRLTNSGLGCDDWPRCNNKTFVDVSSKHAAIEQINRLFTGVVAVSVIVAVLGSLVRIPRRRDLTWLSLGLVAGVIGQAVLGGLVVLSHLNPVLVQGHFLLSMVLMANALILHRRAACDDDPAARDGDNRRNVGARPNIRARARLAARPGNEVADGAGLGLSQGGRRRERRPPLVVAIGALGTLAVITGTVVSGAGPHSGSVDGVAVDRLSISPLSAVRIHSAAVLTTLALMLILMRRVAGRDRALMTALELLVVAGVAQGALGYIQYFSGVPVVLVALHVAGATAVWLALVNLMLVTGSESTPAGGRTPAIAHPNAA